MINSKKHVSAAARYEMAGCVLYPAAFVFMLSMPWIGTGGKGFNF